MKNRSTLTRQVLVLVALLAGSNFTTRAQTGGVGVGTTTPNGQFEVATGAPSVIGTPATDQQSTSGQSSTVANSYWQSFTAGSSGQLAQLAVYGGAGNNAGAVTAPALLEVFAGTGTGGAVLASQNFVLARYVNNTTPTTVSFGTPGAVVAGQVYTFRVSLVNPGPGVYGLASFCTNNCYGGGAMSINAGWDANFQTMVSTSTLSSLQSRLLVKDDNVGIGTTTPGQKLEVAGQVFSNTGGFRFPDNTVQTTAAVTPTATPNTTASNGLTTTGNNIALGGTLTRATTIAQAGNNFSLTGGNVGIGTSSPAGLLDIKGGTLGANVLDQSQTYGPNSTGTLDQWQSFTVGLTGSLTQVDMLVSSPTGANGAPGTLSIYTGEGTGGTLLSSQAIVYNQVLNTYQQYVLTTPVAVTAGQQYTYRFQTPTISIGFVTFANPLYQTYAGGQFSLGGDACFKTYVTPLLATNVLTALPSGNVGIGISTPSAKLDVNGSVKIEGNNTLEFGAGVAGKEINAGKIGYGAFSSGASLDIVGAGTANNNRVVRVFAEGGAYFNGPVTGVGAFNSSDSRLKQAIRPLTGALALVQALHGRRYQWNALGVQRGGRAQAEQVGVIAQELEQVLPELVSTDSDGFKAVNYAQLTPVLIEALKEQQQQIEILKAQNQALQARTALVEADHASLLTLQAQLARLLGEGAQAQK